MYAVATALQRPHIDWRLKVHPVDTLDLLSERDMSRYRLQRRLIGPVYRAENVARYRKAIDKVLDSAVTKIHSLQGAKVDLKEWMHIISVECLGAVVLSWSPGLLKQGTDWGTSTHSYRAWRRKSVMGLFPTVAKLEMCYKIIGRVFSHVWDLTFIPPPNFRPFFPPIGRRISKRIKAMNRGSKQDHDDLAADLMRIHQEKPAFSEPYLRKMIMTNFGAGHETLASTLTSVMAMIGTHDEVPRKLSEELRSSDSITMHYLEAVIKETKRLHPVIATALPRRVPREGLHIDGVFVPAGTTVGCNPIALHRNEDICGPDPDVFSPERWLDSLDCARDMEQFSLSWGGGARTCPGRQLAEMIVQKVISRMTEEFELEVHMPDFQEMPSYFLSIMTGVSVRFLPKRKDQG
ncbi:Cytochrome P450 [Geosmithia morbida]|uniref:Cytochrome P450 n=1 Tax=Geosmithia morbida TaxID=1094350 RepID=A0A9P4Z159_9HYPO|nr:Cytochrome P450 [Geosmithia morbida]KAF4125512.1 Cytochrome P450 [Geosmithia morbida]